MTAVETCEAPATAMRKRGAALENAILEAAFAELTEVGYTAFSVEGVASRARTGKASIYRRWPTKQELVADALVQRMPLPEQCGVVVDLDDSLTTRDVLLQTARAIAAVITSPTGSAVRAIKCEAMADPELAKLIDERFQAPRRAFMMSVLQRGVTRGEVRPEAASHIVADVLPAVITHRVILQREPITERDIVDLMEQVMIPLVEVH